MSKPGQLLTMGRLQCVTSNKVLLAEQDFAATPRPAMNRVRTDGQVATWIARAVLRGLQ